MSKRANPLHRVKLVYRRSSTLLKCVVLAAIVLSIAALIVLRAALVQVQSRNEILRTQAAQLDAENKELKEDISQADSLEGIEKIAQEELGLVDPNASFFTPAD